MNLTEALHVALPDLPPRSSRKRRPRLHPRVVARQQMEDGEPVIYAIVSGANQLYRFTPQQWEMLQLFNGERSYEDVSNAHKERTGVHFSPESIQEYVSELEEIWYTSPQEPNVMAAQKGAEERHKRAAKKWEDITTITVGHWDPDTYLTRLHEKAKFVYTGWFTLLTLFFFAIMASIFIDRWSEIGTDTLKYYNFTQKGLGDIVEFWLLFCFLGFFHESAHGLTCKHFGGAVHKMGFLLYYLEPCFFVDVTEVYIYAGKWARVATSIAGIWVELIFCSAASIIWWGTPAGTPVHEFTYKIILVTGVGVAVINLNPLIKLDGYYILCELVGIIGLKEDSTAFVSTWIKRHVFRLPVEVEFVPRRRRWLFAVYAILSGIYSYTLLYVVVSFCYNVFRKSSPEWAFVPAGLLALLIFKSRIRGLVRFMKTLYLDKKERARRWLVTPRAAFVGALAILLLFTPIWPETRTGRFNLEPIRKAAVHASVAGEVASVFPAEGQFVAAGAPLVRLRNLGLEGRAAQVASELQGASLRAAQARLHYADYSRAERERESLGHQSAELASQLSALQPLSPISGIVITPRLADLAGSSVEAGALLLEVADVSVLRARIYLPEFDLREVRAGDEVSLKMDSSFERLHSHVVEVAPLASGIEPGLAPVEGYKGLTGMDFYGVTALVPNPDGQLRAGLSGTAKILVAHRTLAGLAGKQVRDFVDRKIW
ncbi:MAG: HlyD family efflux transporter periplasmic adaptor subunit [Candidatus Sulfotelmatobacter sp.]